ncbi:hypothetical protein M9H77_28253 [Catharanthus roseus]|uniref:Uncharacterized protein n=1 Tax=Catharanthus roseus TaxID=4058 RepID=A0ACC0AGH2_CATRO|nr:hypothetical protein M9H77_28253 [Catharanthus roseus]
MLTAARGNSDEPRKTRCRAATVLYGPRSPVPHPLSLSLTLNLSLSFSSLSNTPCKRSSDDPRKPTVTGSRRTDQGKPTVKKQRRLNFKRKRKWWHKKRGERGY